MPHEDFFVMVTMSIGPLPPWAVVRNFQGRGDPRWSLGMQAWLRDTPKGHQFTQCVTAAGEAKSRAAKLLSAYYWWLKKQEDKDGRIV